ncbi:MAG: FAD-dependent thymidylate synthase [Promethearchaeota archaeon]
MVRVVEPSFEVLYPRPLDGNQILELVEIAGRTCYKSEGRISEGSAAKFVKMIVGRGHESVIEHATVTVKIVTSRGVTHELVRHRLAAYSQESTRYIAYDSEAQEREVKVVRPYWWDEGGTDPEKLRGARWAWAEQVVSAERGYKRMRRLGFPPQAARGLLPIDVKTEIVATYNLREWRHVFKLRTSPAAHPDIRKVMGAILEHFKEKIPVVFDDLS